jgi:PmbA protein
VTDALELAGAALAAAAGDEAEAVVQVERSGLARFAGSEVHQPTLVEDTVVQLTILRESRVGTASSNRTDTEGLGRLAQRAAEAADASPIRPALPPLPAPAAYPDVEGLDEETASLAAREQARLAAEAIGAVPRFSSYGFFTSAACELAIASTTGLEAGQRFTDATVLVLAAEDDASGFAQRTSWKAAELDPAAVARGAVEKAERTRAASELDPGTYPAVLEPYAIAELLEYFAWDTFNGLALVEERSYLSGRVGEQLFDERVSIADDAIDARGLPKAFDFEGVPKRRVPLVERGVAAGVVWDRASAARAGAGQESTGHALPARLREWGSPPTALSLAPGEAASAEELAQLIGDGIYVTRVHYLGIVSPRDGVLTGMTRDGTFRIRSGRIAEPLVNLRFTVSMPELLADVPGLTRDRLFVGQTDYYDERYPTGALVPAIASGRFTVTGTGSRPGI